MKQDRTDLLAIENDTAAPLKGLRLTLATVWPTTSILLYFFNALTDSPWMGVIIILASPVFIAAVAIQTIITCKYVPPALLHDEKYRTIFCFLLAIYFIFYSVALLHMNTNDNSFIYAIFRLSRLKENEISLAGMPFVVACFVIWLAIINSAAKINARTKNTEASQHRDYPSR